MLGQLPAGVSAAAPSVVVAEVFGPTVQGEGRNLGQRAAFVRLGGCNLHCAWCDTPYTWDASRFDLRAEMTRRPVADIVAEVRPMRPHVVVLTGGEPLLHQGQASFHALVHDLAEVAAVEVETNGTIAPRRSLPVAHFNVSPKLAHGGDPESARIVRPALEAFAELARSGRASLKVVCQTPDDVAEAAALARALDWPAGQVYVMPEGTDVATLARRHAELAEAVIEQGVNMTTRLHVLAWGQERGR